MSHPVPPASIGLTFSGPFRAVTGVSNRSAIHKLSGPQAEIA
jgi:hypothetical protein